MTPARRALPYLLGLALVAAAGLALYAMGRNPICECGYVQLWHGEVASSGNSQHLGDWYTPSHLIHGFVFFWLSGLVMPRAGFGWRLLAALAVEVGWEILENTDAVIDRYRATTISLDYYGDSVINSLADIGAMAAGFWLASRLPVGVTIALAVGFELWTTLAIRDGLILNVLMLVWPIEAVRVWQGG